jgi:hypothetical protein
MEVNLYLILESAEPLDAAFNNPLTRNPPKWILYIAAISSAMVSSLANVEILQLVD